MQPTEASREQGKQSTAQLLAQVANDLESLSEADLMLVAAFVISLKQRPPVPVSPRAVAAIREEAARRAVAMRDVPRADLVRQFQAVAEEIRQQALEQGTLGQALGLLTTDQPPPTDEEVARWLDEYRTEKYS